MKPSEIDEMVDGFKKQLPDGGQSLERCAMMVGCMVKGFREKRGSEPMAAHLRDHGFEQAEIENLMPSAMIFVSGLPRELWRFD